MVFGEVLSRQRYRVLRKVRLKGAKNIVKHLQQYFGETKDELFFKNELFFQDSNNVSSRSARPSASYT